MGNEKLSVKYDFVWDVINDAQKAEIMAMGEDYKAFMDASKTERVCADEIVRRAKEAGFVDLNTVTELKAGDKVLMSKYAGTEVKVDGVEYTILRQSDILAIVE